MTPEEHHNSMEADTRTARAIPVVLLTVAIGYHRDGGFGACVAGLWLLLFWVSL